MNHPLIVEESINKPDITVNSSGIKIDSGGGIEKKQISDLRKKAREFIESLHQRKKRYKNRHKKFFIYFSNKGIRKTFNRSGHPAKLWSMFALPEMLINAKHSGSSDPDEEGQEGIYKFHYFKIRVFVDGEPFTAKLTVTEHTDEKHRYYFHRLDKIGVSFKAGGPSDEDTGPALTPTTEESISENAANVNDNPVIHITGHEFDQEKKFSISELRNEAKQFVKNLQSEGGFPNTDSGFEIWLNNSGIKRVFAYSGGAEKLKSLAAFREILTDSRYLGYLEPNGNQPGVEKYHYLQTGINIGDEVFQICLTVAEHNDKEHQYYLHNLEFYSEDGQLIQEDTNIADPVKRIDAAATIRDLIEAVKGYTLSNSLVLKGNKTIIETARGMEVEVQYLVVPQTLLVASHSAKGKRNPEFPDNFQNTSRDRMKAKLQNRDRSSHVSQYQADMMAKNLRPRLLGSNPFASDGAPVTNSKLKPGKYVVLSGNGRTISLGLACALKNDSNDKYFEWLSKEARNFGIKPEEIAQIRCPRVIRNVTQQMTDQDLTKFVKQANKPSIQAPSAQEVAVEDASEISTDMLKLISPTKDGRIEGNANIGFIQAFFQNVLENDPAEIGRMQTRDGKLTDEGVDRITRAVFMRAYGDPSLIDKLVRRGDDESKKLTKGLLMAASEMAKLGDDLAEINRLDLDISSDVVKAVLELETIRSEKGRTVEDVLAYVTFDDEDIRNDPVIVELLKGLEKTGIGHRGKPDNVRDFILEYVKQANAAVQESTMGSSFASVFGEAEYKKDKMLEAARKAVVQESMEDIEVEDISALMRIVSRNQDARKILSRLVGIDEEIKEDTGNAMIEECFISNLLGETANVIEEKLITFPKKYGQIVFLAGGGGSGKGFVISKFMNSADFKTIDVDYWKGQFLKLAEETDKYPELKGMDLRNPKHVFALHQFVKERKIKAKKIKGLFDGVKIDRLPNVIFDVTMNDEDSMREVIPMALKLGYDPKDIHLVWVLTNYHTAVANNKSRSRIVPDNIMLQAHEGVALLMKEILKGNGFIKDREKFNGSIHVVLNNREETKFYSDGKTIKSFTYLTAKKPGKRIAMRPEDEKKLAEWIRGNIPRTEKTKELWDDGKTKADKTIEESVSIEEIAGYIEAAETIHDIIGVVKVWFSMLRQEPTKKTDTSFLKRFGTEKAQWNEDLFAGANLKELKLILRFVGLPMSGKKEELIDRLVNGINKRQEGKGYYQIREIIQALFRTGNFDGSKKFQGLPVGMQYILNGLLHHGMVSQSFLDDLKNIETLFMSQKQYEECKERQRQEKIEAERQDRLANPEKWGEIDRKRAEGKEKLRQMDEERANRIWVIYDNIDVMAPDGNANFWNHDLLEQVRNNANLSEWTESGEYKEFLKKIPEIESKIEEVKANPKLSGAEKEKKIAWWGKRLETQKRMIDAFHEHHKTWSKAIPEIEALLNKEQRRREAKGEQFDERGIKIENGVPHDPREWENRKKRFFDYLKKEIVATEIGGDRPQYIENLEDEDVDSSDTENSFNPSVGDTVYIHWLASGKDEPVNYRGREGDQAVIVKDGSQMMVPFSDLKAVPDDSPAKKSIKDLPLEEFKKINPDELEGDDVIDYYNRQYEERKKEVEQFIKDHSGEPFMYKTDGGLTLIFHKMTKVDDIKEGYNWQLSIIGTDGIPNGDTRYKTYEEGVKDAVREWNVDLSKVTIKSIKKEEISENVSSPVLSEVINQIDSAQRISDLIDAVKKWHKVTVTKSAVSKEEAEQKNEELRKQVIRDLTEHPILKGLAISAELLENKTASILGQKVKSAKELAGVTQIFRDPRYETLRYIFLKGKEVVGHTSVSCRMPGVSKAFPVSSTEKDKWMQDQLTKHGADGFYLLHNHPSGRSNPSSQDIGISRYFEDLYPIQYRGHVVIDSHEYSFITKSGDVETYEIEQDNDNLLKPSIEHPLLGEKIGSPDDVLEIGQKLKKDGWFTLISHGNAGVRGIMEVPLKMVTDLNNEDGTINDAALKKMMAVIRRFAVTSGAQDVFATGVPILSKYKTFYISAIEKGLLRDIIDVNGKSAMAKLGVQKEGGYFLGREFDEMRTITREATQKNNNSEKKITLVSFDKKNMLWIDGYPVKNVTAKKVPEFLRSQGANEVHVEFKTMEKYREQDLKTFTKRAEKIAGEAGYVFNGFANKVVEGNIFDDTYEGVLTRSKPDVVEEKVKVEKDVLNDVIDKIDLAKTISDILKSIEILFQAPTETKRKIEDFGEKIGGAAKDRWKENNLTVDDLNDLNDREALEFVKKDNIWKKIDYKALVDSGKDPVTAFLLKKIRDAIPVKVEIPKSRESEAKEYFRKYIELVERIRDNAEIVQNPEDFINFDERVFINPDTGKELSLSHEDSFLGAIDYKKRRKLYWALRINKYNIEKARRQVKETGWPESQPWLQGYRIVDNAVGYDGTFVAKGNYIVREGFENKEDAEAWLKLQYDEKLSKRKKAGPKAVRPQLENIERVGVDHRQGKDVTGDDMLQTFKFRGGEFGNWLSEQDRQQSLNHAYDALMDLSQSMGIPAEALSLGGRLSFAFGARGKSKALAHYEPARRVINLTKMKGAGSLAHEFGHAFDHMLGDLSGNSGLETPYASRQSNFSSMRPELAEAFKRLKDSILYREVTTEEYIRIQIQKLDRINNEMEYLLSDLDLKPNEKVEKNFQDIVDVFLRMPDDNKPLIYLEWGTPLKSSWDSILYDFVEVETGKRVGSEFQTPFVKLLNEKIGFISKISTNNIHKHPTKVPSQFAEDAMILDGGKAGKYWSNSQELFARAFESAIQDKVTAAGGKSDYLVHSTKKNDVYGGFRPYPEGKEREAINLALDDFFGLLKSGKDTTILESIFDELSAPSGTIEEAVTTKKNHEETHTGGRLIRKKTKKAHTLQDSYRFQGLNISIENKRGSTRSGTDADGNEWSTKMRVDYGYIRSTEAKDGDCVDVLVNKIGRKSKKVFVVHQKKIEVVKQWKNGICPDCGNIHSECNHAYDEDKVMLGFASKEDAIKAYLQHYDSKLFLGPVSTYSLKEFKKVLEQSFGKKLPNKIEEAVALFSKFEQASTLDELLDSVAVLI